MLSAEYAVMNRGVGGRVLGLWDAKCVELAKTQVFNVQNPDCLHKFKGTVLSTHSMGF